MGKLKVGDEAPEIVGRSLNMGEFRLSDLRGRERVYLVLSRYFGCPICQLDFKELLERAEEARRQGFEHGPYEGNERQSPADFIVSKEGKIEYANYGLLDLDKMMKVWTKE